MGELDSVNIMINQYNEHGLKEGYWSNGNLWYKGVFINGLKDGDWEFYHPNGKLWGKGYFVNDKFHDYWEWYTDSGNLIEKEFVL
jgi:antitoxin component YwqK of YwqJK toxin-antitoxin module